MKKIIFLICSSAILIGCKEEEKTEKMAQIEYPETKTVDTIDIYFGTEVKDPYRWLEDDRSSETEEWVKKQNEVTFNYLDQIPYRDHLKNRLSELWNYEKIGSPFTEGEYTYYYKNDGLQDHYVLYRTKDGKEEVFLNPNTFSKDGTTSLDNVSFSKTGKLAAYSISEGGSDWRKVIILDTETMERVGDTLTNLKFTGLSWKGDDGIYYSTYDVPKGSQLSAKTDTHKLYYHKLGTAQKEDKVIYGATESQKGRYVGGSVTEDDNYLIISRSISTSGNELYLIDLNKKDAKPVPLITGFDNSSYLLENEGSKLYIVTNLDAPNQRVVTVDASNPGSENWKTFIPETDNALRASTGSGFIYAQYMVDAISKVFQYDYDGKLIQEVELPGIGTVAGFGGKKEPEILYYSFSNYSNPSTIYTYDPKTGVSDIYWKPEIDFNPEDYDSKQIFYTSKDGTKIPMIITHKKGMALDGKNPTILYGYGGFGVSRTPGFSITNAVWMEQGGVYAVPNIRGGGEYGRKWHDAGTKMQKQNVFDDFIAAAEYLIERNYTSSEFLALRGGSNGGLLVGAVVNQRPDLMRVGIASVGVMDMLRYHTFTAGAGWAYDYGTALDNVDMFNYLKDYSPLHNIKENVDYPAILVTTADHDDRVVPAHSFKYIAELQAKNPGDTPKLIRIETDAGHGAGMPVSKQIELNSDVFGFTLYNMGIEKLPIEK